MTKRATYLVLVGIAGVGVGAGSALAARARIDLTEFGRVVHFPEVPTRVTTTQDELTRGTDGWEAARDDDGQYSIGVEWDSPRDLAEVNIEFRHAIANRELIKVQYWKEAAKSASPAGGAHDKKPRGKWLTPKADWWAGDRDVSFAFLPEDKETTDTHQPGVSYRRTTRLRFVCGKQELPPVRYLRAFGPGKVVTDSFDVRFDKDSALPLPVSAEINNGFVMAGDNQTTMQSTTLRDPTSTIVVRYFEADESSPNRTEITMSTVDKPERKYKFLPAHAAQLGSYRIPQAGVVVERRGGKRASTGPATTQPK